MSSYCSERWPQVPVMVVTGGGLKCLSSSRQRGSLDSAWVALSNLGLANLCPLLMHSQEGQGQPRSSLFPSAKVSLRPTCSQEGKSQPTCFRHRTFATRVAIFKLQHIKPPKKTRGAVDRTQHALPADQLGTTPQRSGRSCTCCTRQLRRIPSVRGRGDCRSETVLVRQLFPFCKPRW